MNKYIYAKIGKGNEFAETYLKGHGEISEPAIPIYFDDLYDNKNDFLEKGESGEQGKLFFECGSNTSGKRIVVICNGLVYILSPDGEIVFKKSTIRKDKTGYVKLLPVKILEQKNLADVPAVLAGIGSNRYYSSGTFREISSIGNIRAIRSVLGESIDTPREANILNAIECLGSVEFETLVARILEESGLFVPAYRGGTIQDADLFAYNKSSQDIDIAGAIFVAGQRKSIQIKLKENLKSPPQGIDLLIVASSTTQPGKTLGVHWIESAIRQCGNTRIWLRQSLDWLPKSYLDATCGLA